MEQFKFLIPSDSSTISFCLDLGEAAFVLGANGSGKSSLMHSLYKQTKGQCLRISAHRQTWFASDSLEMSPQTKRQTEQNIKNRDANPDSRWKDDMAAARANIAIYELLDAENVRARKITGEVDASNFEKAKALSRDQAPIALINDLLQLSGLPITLSIQENERLLAKKLNSESYSIAELSDGERNALLIAASVLTAKEGSLILVDEPERHLHRSIISPLLTHLFASRDDCAFVVSTHEVLLPSDHLDSKTLLVRSCSYKNKSVTSWDFDIIDNTNAIPEEIKLDILGSRRRTLFVEGTEESLDKPLYSILFSDTTIVPKSTCKEVEASVFGVRGCPNLHWAEAYGIVDRDGRSDEDFERLKQNGVYAIDCYSVESLYYLPDIINMIAIRLSEVHDFDVSELYNAAKEEALEEIQKHRDRLCSRIAVRKLRERFSKNLPTEKTVEAEKDFTVTIPVSDLIKKENDFFDQAIEEKSFEKLLQRYPLRQTGALDIIAKKFFFKNRKQYEASVIKICREDEDARQLIVSLLGGLEEVLF